METPTEPDFGDEPHGAHARRSGEDIAGRPDDLAAMRAAFSTQGRQGRRDRVPGLRPEPLLRVGAAAGQPGAHAAPSANRGCTSPPSDIAEDEYIQWDYGKGYVDALTDTGLEPGRHDRGDAVPVVRDAVRRRTSASARVRALARRDPPATRSCSSGGSTSARPGRCCCARATNPSELFGSLVPRLTWAVARYPCPPCRPTSSRSSCTSRRSSPSLASHGVSMVVLYRIRRERDRRKILDLVTLSGETALPMYVVDRRDRASRACSPAFKFEAFGQPWLWIAIVAPGPHDRADGGRREAVLPNGEGGVRGPALGRAAGLGRGAAGRSSAARTAHLITAIGGSALLVRSST